MSIHPRSALLFSVLAASVLVTSSARAQPAPTAAPAPEEASDLAKKLSNPVADLVSIPLQFNWENGVGPDDDLRFVLNLQPVIPFSLNEDWNLIGRVIMPFVGQPALVPGGMATSGLSDIVASAFFSPTRSGIVWGVGPVLSLPTTTDPFLGSGKWSAGPTAVVLKQTGPWTYGALVNHLWSYANTGDIDRTDVNQTYLQPFVAFGTKTAVTFNVSTEATANWESDGDTWTVPLLFNVSKITKLGPFPFSVGAGIGAFVVKPEGGPSWKLRMVGTVILPRGR